MAKLSISLPDELANDLRAVAPGNVSAFVSAAVRHELDRRHLLTFLAELEDELGPPDEEEVAGFSAVFTEIEASSTRADKPERAAMPKPRSGH
ncbi:MAG TPA: hypothetical protein VGS19_28115 [Streptosporangiaceae bacterium]|nr:hypothetical protein [Streptosporangiaceae bacterium]